MLHALLYEEDYFISFLLVTVFLGGGAAWLSGRAIAHTWRPWGSIVGYMLLLGLVIRFIHFALFSGTLLSAYFYAVDTAFALMFASLGFYLARRGQMARQYGFLRREPDSSAPYDAAS